MTKIWVRQAIPGQSWVNLGRCEVHSIGARRNVQFPGLDPKLAPTGVYIVFMGLDIVGYAHCQWRVRFQLAHGDLAGSAPAPAATPATD
ncbi:hypothetical protein AB4Z48_20380 [Cupriavidus sp. 2TAF22]|uniref:hypothetical protein n=1 Tax=unclassified Cupriavidus TaxID=2640874 RepID=UPI003F925934